MTIEIERNIIVHNNVPATTNAVPTPQSAIPIVLDTPFLRVRPPGHGHNETERGRGRKNIRIELETCY
jgi:hypothetical protein